ncbi:MAG: metallophosphoesterase family protein [Candidatus Chromulinivorax sp.]
MVTFIHTADIHFGMENYGRIDPKTGIHSRLLDFEKSLNICIDYAIEHQVDFFLFSGDAYKTATPSPTQQKLLMRCFMRLYKANIPIVIIVGNHDNPLSFGKANSLDVFASIPLDGFHIFAKPDKLTLSTKSGTVQIVGIPWPNRHNITLKSDFYAQTASQITEQISNTLAQIITKLAQELDPNIPAVLAGHLTVSNGVFSGSERKAIYGQDPVLLPSQLAINPFDYVALGHLHRFQNLNPQGIPIVYSGSIDRVDFGERNEEKGFCVVKINEKKETSFEFITIPTRPFIQIDVALEENEEQTIQILQAIKQRNITDAIVKITYQLSPTMTDAVDIKKIQLACTDAMYLVGIIPIRQAQTRSYRSILSQEMDLQTLLKNYFESKENLKHRCDDLIEKTLNLQNDLEHNDLIE